MTESTALTTSTAPAPSPLAFLHDGAAFEHIWRVAKAFSCSRMVPQHFQGKPEDCMVALMMAQQLEVNPLLALQNLQVVNGRAGFSASFAIGLANQRGPFAGPITWTNEGHGDDLVVVAHAVVKATREEVSVPVSMATAKAEGWVKNPKYRSMPEQMLRYRSAVWLIRLHCPEVLLGLSTDEEIWTQNQNPSSRGAKPVQVVDQTLAAASSGTIVEQLNQQIRATAETVDVSEVALPTTPQAMQSAEADNDNQPEDPFS
jgi:hypothetical protein